MSDDSEIEVGAEEQEQEQEQEAASPEPKAQSKPSRGAAAKAKAASAAAKAKESASAAAAKAKESASAAAAKAKAAASEKAASLNKAVAEASTDKSTGKPKWWNGVKVPFLPFAVVLAVFAVLRFIFGTILSKQTAPTEVTSLMETDRVFGWMLGPLAAIVALVGSSALATRKARRFFAGLGTAVAIVLLIMNSFVSQYLSTYETSDLKAAGARAEDLVKMRGAELGVVLVYLALLVGLFIFKVDHAEA